jgi:2-iminobutanoate/2-iminopropanoate deaminase
MKTLGNQIALPDGTIVPFSAGVDLGDMVILSGQLPLKGGAVVAGGIAEQTHAVIDNIEDLLASASCTLGDVVKTTIWLTDGGNFAGFNSVYGERFAQPYPARSTVVSGLLFPGALIEIEVMARRSLP